ncbi:MAG TPA: hypothetical protein VE173_12635, partial [Longimicrobiales bacterium]|nr:hypothetical protein [Longimicrobiales bacterium]
MLLLDSPVIPIEGPILSNDAIVAGRRRRVGVRTFRCNSVRLGDESPFPYFQKEFAIMRVGRLVGLGLILVTAACASGGGGGEGGGSTDRYLITGA